MFDIIGYWGVITLTMMMPIVAIFWLLCCFTNARVKELGGQAVPAFVAFDKALERGIYGIPVVIGCIVSVVVSVIWCLANMTNSTVLSFIGWHSTFSEKLSPFSGFVLAAIAALVAYDMALRAYVRITKLVTKLEEKA